MAKDAVSIEVDGLKELRRELRNLGDKEMRLINKEGSDKVRDTARDMAPVVSGRLKKSIGSLAGQTSAKVKAGTAARVPYAGPVIFGHRPRPQGGYTEPNNFLIRALGHDAEYIRRLYDERLNKLANKHL